MPGKPLCFVLMPFGTKPNPGGGPAIDFDKIYKTGIRPAIEDAEMEPIRADAERTGGVIHKAMYERLILCDFAVADLTTANPNVFYELGIRHGLRPHTTLPIFAKQQQVPFDVNFVRSLPYALGENNRFELKEATALREELASRLKELRTVTVTDGAVDSPVFTLIKDLTPPDIKRLKTDTFRDQVSYSQKRTAELAVARSQNDLSQLQKIESELGDFAGAETGVIVDLYLSYRAISAWQQMVDLYTHMPAALRRQTMMREQYGFALNRLKRRDEAVSVLEALIEEQGPASETCGILGRVYKDQWVEAEKEGAAFKARGLLKKAIHCYLHGFEADWRDAYPGINAVTLLDILGDEASISKKETLLPVVKFAVEQRLKHAAPDYWDHATLLELAVLGNDSDDAHTHLENALAAFRETWEADTTANNLKLIQEHRRRRNQSVLWVNEIVDELEKVSKG